MAKIVEGHLVVAGKRYGLTKRKKSKDNSDYVNFGGSIFALEELSSNGVFASEAAATATLFNEAVVQELLLKAVKIVRHRPELLWSEIENIHIGDDLENPPGGKQIWVNQIQSEFNRQLRIQFPEIVPLGDNFLWNWSLGHPQETYGHVVLVLDGFLNPNP
jgi:hypothetical protein